METVVEGLSGTFFEDQTVSSLKGALQKFERMEFDMNAIRAHAETFDRDAFRANVSNYISERWEEWKRSPSRSRSESALQDPA